MEMVKEPYIIYHVKNLESSNLENRFMDDIQDFNFILQDIFFSCRRCFDVDTPESLLPSGGSIAFINLRVHRVNGKFRQSFGMLE